MNQELLKYEEFEAVVQNYFQKNAGKNARVRIRTVLKNNGVKLRGLSVFREGETVTPSVYLGDFYEIYKKEGSLDGILECMGQYYEEKRKTEDIDVAYYYDYERVRETLRVRLINYERNVEFLETVPHVRILDLALVSYSYMEQSPLENGYITVTAAHMELWKIDRKRLFADAIENSCKTASRIRLELVKCIEDMIKERGEDIQAADFCEEECSMCVLTNEQKLNGAGVLVYPGCLEECGAYYRSDYYILPSSIHELLVLPAEDVNETVLVSMVQDVNDAHVASEEILSYHVYRYSCEQGILEDVVTKDTVSLQDVLSLLV